ISGGTENIRYRISGTWFNNDGMLKIGPDRNEKYTGRVNLDTRLNKYLNVSTNLSYSKNFIEKPAGGGRLEGTYGFLSNLFTYPGVTPLYDPNGHWAWGSRLGSGGALDGRNKIADVSSDAGINTRDQNNIRMNTSLEIGNFVEGLRFRLVGVIDANFNNTFDHNRPIPEHGVDETRLGNAIYSRNSVAKSNSKSAFKEFQFLTDYSKSFTNHAIHLLGGYSFQDYRLESFSVSANDLVNHNLPSLTWASNTGIALGDRVATNAFQSVFGGLNYVFRDRYLLEGNMRYDGSSQLSPNNRYKWFPSASAGWRISEEPWFNIGL